MLFYPISILTLLSRQVFGETASQLCRGSAELSDDGNWYCSEVTAITYKNISQPGKYNRTTGVNPDTGLCHHEPISYSGVSPFTPLIGELSMHLRGPMNVSQIAVYKLPGFSNSKREVALSSDAEGWTQQSQSSLATDEASQATARSVSYDKLDETLIGNIESPALRQRWGIPKCTFTPTVTETVFVSTGVCEESQISSLKQPVFMPSALPEPPVVPLLSSQPTPQVPSVVTTTVHDTVTTCPEDQVSSSALFTSELQFNASSEEPPCPCMTTMEAQIPSTDASQTSESDCTSTVTDSVAMAFPLPVKRNGKGQVSTSMYTPTKQQTTSTAQVENVNKADASMWNRVAYYTSTAPAAATGFAFLANLGDPRMSGTFDYSFGNSLGYVIGDGSKVAADSTPFDGTLETSEREIAVFTDKVCDSNCEYARPDTTSHYGWEGPSKAFFIEFQMDHYDNIGSDQGMLSDAPAWWFLNAAIPRILQYGNDKNNIPCSCWSTGCGEFDAFEILGRGEMRAKSTIHRQGNLEGGDSNYFLRPVGKTLKFAVVFHNWNITARVLDDSFDFSSTLTQAQIDKILAYDANDASHSLFAIGD